MNALTRDPKTGRFMSKSKKAEAMASLGKKTLKVKTDKHLQVFSKKSIEENTSSRMRPGAEVMRSKQGSIIARQPFVNAPANLQWSLSSGISPHEARRLEQW